MFSRKIAKAGVKTTLDKASVFAADIRTVITGDISPEKLAAIEIKAQEIEASIAATQGDIEKQEAASANLFVVGWRPAIGWTGAIALFIHYVVRPIVDWIFKTELPPIELEGLYPIIIGMLGLGAYRTAEKIKGVQDLH